MKERHADILIVGGGLGGIAAALAAVRLGRTVILTEQLDWIGGQLTAQGVPPDENPWIDRENTGCTASYRALREGIRDYYRRYYPLLPEASANPYLNPGMGNVSPLCHEPRVALAVLHQMIAPYCSNGRLLILTEYQPIAVECDGDRVRAVTFLDIRSNSNITISAMYIIDATELGDLLDLADIEHVTGAESQTETGEPHALVGPADPLDQQAFSWCFVLDYIEGQDHTIDRPQQYTFWRDYKAEFWPDRQLSWTVPDPETLHPVYRPIFLGPREDRVGHDLWHYRRIIYSQYFPHGTYASDIVVVNWPQLDYWLGPLVGVSEAEKTKNLYNARELSLSLLYWMQTEAPRLDGGAGYPNLRLRGDIYGTTDGLAKSVYIRESRRIKAEFTVLEQHIGVEARGKLEGAEQFYDTVGIGSYRIDLHPSTGGRNYIDITNWPFQIPLGSLIPVRVDNLLPGCKNIGVTHITNGCYRLHPVEWNIGEAAGALAAYCLNHNVIPRQVRNTKTRLSEFQSLLANNLGVILTWPEHIRITPRIKFDTLGI